MKYTEEQVLAQAYLLSRWLLSRGVKDELLVKALWLKGCAMHRATYQTNEVATVKELENGIEWCLDLLDIWAAKDPQGWGTQIGGSVRGIIGRPKQ